MENLKHVQRKVLKKFSLYLTVNTPHVHYKSVSLSAVRETMTVCCRNATKHTNTLRGQNTDYFNVEVSGMYSYHIALGANNISDGHSHLISILQPSLPTTQY